MRQTATTLDIQANALADLLFGAELLLKAKSRVMVRFVLPRGEVKSGVITWPEMKSYATEGGDVTQWSINLGDNEVITGEPEELGVDDRIPSDALVIIRGMNYEIQDDRE